MMATSAMSLSTAVAWAGDLNNDGYDDLLVGAYKDAQAGVNAGKCHVFLGGSSMNPTADLVIAGPAAGAYFAGLPESPRKMALYWIASAKRPETRARRVAEVARAASEGRRAV